MSTITLRVEKSKALSKELLEIASHATAQPLADVRDRLTARAVDYATELHASLVDLVGLGRYASAAAMIRLLMESALTCLYILHLLDPGSAQRLEDNEEYLPNTARIYRRCIELPIVGPNIKLISESQKPFHKLTHGDMPQLNRRKTFGHWNKTFIEKENINHLCLADILLLAAVDSLSHAVKRPDIQADVRIRRDNLMMEMHQNFGVPIPEPDELTPSPVR